MILAAVMLPYIGFSLGFVVAYLLKRGYSRSITIAIETGIQSAGIAITTLTLSLPQPDSDIAIAGPILTTMVSLKKKKFEQTMRIFIFIFSLLQFHFGLLKFVLLFTSAAKTRVVALSKKQRLKTNVMKLKLAVKKIAKAIPILKL